MTTLESQPGINGHHLPPPNPSHQPAPERTHEPSHEPAPTPVHGSEHGGGHGCVYDTPDQHPNRQPQQASPAAATPPPYGTNGCNSGVSEVAERTAERTAGSTSGTRTRGGDPSTGAVRDGSGGSPADTAAAGAVRRVRLTPAAGIELRPTYWLWDQRIPTGSIVLGPGREGIGKSLFCAWLTARITRGDLPGAHHGTPRSVVYAATEDSWERTIAGRLIAADADMNRVYRVDVDHLAGHTVPLSLPRDCAGLAVEMTAHDVALLILDPLISAVDSQIDANSEKLRDALEPLARMADDTEVAVFGLAHFNKASGGDVLSRITGSRAFAAVARAAVAFARDPAADDGSCVISQAKNNLGPLDLPSLRYIVESVTLDTAAGPADWGRLRIIGETTRHVNDILREAENGAERDDDRAELGAWLRDFLTSAGGSAAPNDVFKAGAALGYSRDQLKRAKKPLGITSKGGGATGWHWTLPANQHPTKTAVKGAAL